MRGLRDFNWPKIVVEDRQIFLGLINDLFPRINAPPQINEVLQARIRECTKDAGLQPDESFILKCVQLSEILDVRHSVFIVGNPGCAKSTIWKVLQAANNISPLDESKPDGPKNITIEAIVDPKAVSSAELYGDMNPKTKEWKDGILAVVMRDMKNNSTPYKEEQTQKWIVLDGDVDPEWIETMNTVMDDNKVLTLVSQERIPLTAAMRLMLEISHLKNATPATVSRGGVLFVNDADVGWRPYFESWLAKYKSGKNKDENAFNVFSLALTQYINDSFIDENKNKNHIAPVCEMGQVVSLCTIIDDLYQQLHSIKAQNEMIKKYKEEQKDDEIK
jgi:dynein heavy chain, axonemal